MGPLAEPLDARSAESLGGDDARDGHRAHPALGATPCSPKEVMTDEQVLYGVADDRPRKL